MFYYESFYRLEELGLGETFNLNMAPELGDGSRIDGPRLDVRQIYSRHRWNYSWTD